MSRISIVVPVYNAEETLGRCIDSLLSQTFNDIEIILIDDGSKDNSGEICDTYAKKDSRIFVIHKINEGVSKARNTGIERATSDYILFVDSDDYIKDNMCEVLFNAIEHTNYEVVMCGYERSFVFNGYTTKSVLILPELQAIKSIEQYKKNWVELFKKSLFNAPWGKLYKMDYIKENSIFFNESIHCGEDLLFNLEVFSHIYKIAVVNEPLYIYECTEKESLTTKFDAEKKINDRFLYNITLDYLKKMNMLSLCNHSVAQIYMRSCFRTFEQTLFIENRLTSKEKKECVKSIVCCKETLDAIQTNVYKSFESLIYALVLKTRSYFIVSLFTKIRFAYKTFSRKGLKF
ncbi:glycosyltransferase family 2 protein [Paenibacillus sp. GXUN7292]|uniref:glycosyltransferase family 2 protein n=1 Tax=Paenibacillus sp. GXUN7292 TaxID=3422499 RepID=UPI003D7EE2C9